jgi:putative MFS transporter
METKQEIAWLNARVDRLTHSGLTFRQFAIIGAAYFFVFYDLSVVGFTLPDITEDLSLSGGQAAGVVSIYLGSYVVGAVTLASFADKYGRRRGLLYTVIAIAVGGLLSGVAWGFWSLAIARFIVGAGTGAEIALASTIVTETSPSRKRGKYLQYMYFWGAAGLTLTPFITLLLLKLDNGWRYSLAVGGLIAIVLAFSRKKYLDESPRWLVLNGRAEEARDIVQKMEAISEKKSGHPLPPPREDEIPLESSSTDNRLVKKFFQKPYLKRTLVTLAFWTLWLIPVDAYLSYAPTILSSAQHQGASGIVITAIGYIGTPVGALLAFFLVDIGQRKYLISVIAFIFGCALAVMAVNPSGIVVVIAAFVASAMISANSAVYAYMAEIYPTSMRATGFGILDSGGNVGGALAPFIVVGLISIVHESGTLWILAASLICSAVILAVGGIKTSRKSIVEISGN